MKDHGQTGKTKRKYTTPVFMKLDISLTGSGPERADKETPSKHLSGSKTSDNKENPARFIGAS